MTPSAGATDQGRTMGQMPIAAGILSLLIWGSLLLARGQFWRIRPALPPRGVTAPLARIAVIIPARNEADVVGRAVTSLLQQTGGHSVHIFLVDDGSSDGTAQAVKDAATALSPAGMVTVIAGGPLPSGWSGKIVALPQSA